MPIYPTGYPDIEYIPGAGAETTSLRQSPILTRSPNPFLPIFTKPTHWAPQPILAPRRRAVIAHTKPSLDHSPSLNRTSWREARNDGQVRLRTGWAVVSAEILRGRDVNYDDDSDYVLVCIQGGRVQVSTFWMKPLRHDIATWGVSPVHATMRSISPYDCQIRDDKK